MCPCDHFKTKCLNSYPLLDITVNTGIKKVRIKNIQADFYPIKHLLYKNDSLNVYGPFQLVTEGHGLFFADFTFPQVPFQNYCAGKSENKIQICGQVPSKTSSFIKTSGGVSFFLVI